MQVALLLAVLESLSVAPLSSQQEILSKIKIADVSHPPVFSGRVGGYHVEISPRVRSLSYL